MDYQLNIFLDEYAVEVDTGPGRGAKLAAHLWFKKTDSPKGWVPVGDPVRLSISADRVFFAMGDVYDELSADAKYRILFGGGRSPFDVPTTTALDNGSAFGPFTGGMACLTGSRVVRTSASGLHLANRGSFEFSIEVDDGSKIVYYLDPQMIVDP